MYWFIHKKGLFYLIEKPFFMYEDLLYQVY